MKLFELCNIEILPTDDEKKMFDVLELGKAHTPYQSELIFYSYIQQGNVAKVKENMNYFLSNNLVVGKLSFDDLRQIKYFAVCCITLGIRYAIQGGLSENDAYLLSDKCIRIIDKLSEPEKVVSFIYEKALDITEKVHNTKNANMYSYGIRKCLNYIRDNLTKKLTIKILSKECNFCEDYLSLLFKKQYGITLSSYIMQEKLKLAKKLLNEKFDYNELAYFLSFSSQSHFIMRFKKEFGITPRKYLDSLKY